MRTFAVIGLGRFGKKLAVALTASGAEVIAIDRDRGVIEDIRDQVTHAVRLDGTDQEALKSQAVGRADVAIIGIGQGGQAFEAAVRRTSSPARSWQPSEPPRSYIPRSNPPSDGHISSSRRT
jgi:Trk K+ transport system NAD-binding subunit